MENKLLLNIIEDKYSKFQKDYSLVATDFLDLSQQSAAMGFVKSKRKEGVFFYGGYNNAERKKVIFVPDYFNVSSEEDLFSLFSSDPDISPLVLLDVSITTKNDKLRHSDYMGSILSLGIKREKIGDILVFEDGAQIIVNGEIAEYLAENYIKAGRVPVKSSILGVDKLKLAHIKIEHIRVPIASARLDNAVSAVFGTSRKIAAEAITGGLVFVNSVENKKPDFVLKGDEKLVLRGKGKAIYRGISGTSRKGKVYAEFDKYI